MQGTGYIKFVKKYSVISVCFTPDHKMSVKYWPSFYLSDVMELMGVRAEAEGGDVEKGGEDVQKGGDDVQKEGVKEVER